MVYFSAVQSKTSTADIIQSLKYSSLIENQTFAESRGGVRISTEN